MNTTTDFVTLSGLDVKIDNSLLSAESVCLKAQEHYRTEVICTPCIFAGVYGMKSGSIGWKIEKKDDHSLLGFMVLASTGWYIEYPVEFGSKTLKMCVPFGAEWSQFHSFKVRYVNGKLEIVKAE